MTTANDLKNTANRVARKLTRTKCETSPFRATESDSVEGWLVCGLPPAEKGFDICQLILAEDGKLHLRHETLPKDRKDAKSRIEELPADKAATRGGWSLQTLASRIDHLLTEYGLTD
ncbi:MAG TPA: hypothetical protein VJ841_04180 [Candidatus Saccharimonadales bacterium]|nr:hypothetical protein [Candidatus Saccharimonadales bacterium]